MKNIFKLMGIALMAGSLLFTACKKDEENTNDTTPTPETPATFAITFSGEAQEGLEYANALTNGQTWLFQAALKTEGNSVYFPYFVFYFQGAEELEVADAEAYIETYFNDGQYNYGDWQLEDVDNFDVKKFDATTRRVSLDADYLMYSLADYIDTTIAEGEERTTNMTLNLTNYEFQAAN